MHEWRRRVAAVLVAALLAPVPVRASGPPPSDWSRLHGVRPGHKVSVHLRDGSVRKGAFSSADSAAITVRSKEGPASFARADVLTVRNARRSPARKVAGFFAGAVLGALAGVFAGGALGASTCHEYCEDAGTFGAAFGFLIGVVLGAIGGVAAAAQGEGAVLYAAPAAAP